jgi:hypothetical protein
MTARVISPLRVMASGSRNVGPRSVAPVDSKAPSNVILAADHCGKGNHRDEDGQCHPDDRDHCARAALARGA